MKTVLLAAALVIGGASFASADVPGKDWMTKEQVMTKLKTMGYTDVKELGLTTAIGKAMRSKTGRPTRSMSIRTAAS